MNDQMVLSQNASEVACLFGEVWDLDFVIPSCFDIRASAFFVNFSIKRDDFAILKIAHVRL
jgi:hypothetical protein